MAILAVQEGDLRIAMFWLIMALIVDGLDGTFARYFNVKEVLPGISGKNIDYVVDFLNYAIVPAFMFHEAMLVPHPWNLPLTIIILLASALYYGRKTMVTQDHYFLGFPVLWNMVMFYYIFITNYKPMTYIVITLFLAVLHFVPIKVAYPSRNMRFKISTIAVFCIFLVTMLFAVYHTFSR